jgi:hypothetical protein
MHYFNLLLTQILQCNIDLAKSNIDPPVCNIAFGKSKHENLKTNMKNIKTILFL